MILAEDRCVDASAWDARYRSSDDLVWGAEPNRFVAAELAGLAPGRALDVACGEGRNALWLASEGWQVTGVDFSQVALDRAGQLAGEAGVGDRVTFVCADVVDGTVPGGPFDVVLVAYLQVPPDDRRRVLRHVCGCLAGGGILLWSAMTARTWPKGSGDRRIRQCCSPRRTWSPMCRTCRAFGWSGRSGSTARFLRPEQGGRQSTRWCASGGWRRLAALRAVTSPAETWVPRGSW